MKHLKIYESLLDNPLKKYCIWDNIHWLEILDVSKNVYNGPEDGWEYFSRIIYTLDDNELIKRYNEREISFYENSIPNFVKYTSDDIQDCIDMLYILADTNKYNL